MTAIDLDTGNNARITYRLVVANSSEVTDGIFGIFPNSGWIYLRNNLDRETQEHYTLTVAATDNGTPSQTAISRVQVTVLDANDNDPAFTKSSYEFSVEENLEKGAYVGVVKATDIDLGANAAIKYNLIPNNATFHINPITGKSRIANLFLLFLSIRGLFLMHLTINRFLLIVMNIYYSISFKKPFYHLRLFLVSFFFSSFLLLSSILGIVVD